jgi:hypothetical protein
MFHTGFQYTPVLSIATWVTCCSASQWAKARKSAVIAPKRRTILRGFPIFS